MFVSKFVKLAPFLVLTALNVWSVSAHAREGGLSGGGGDPVEQDFVIQGNAAVNALDQRAREIPSVNVHDVRSLWDSPETKVIPTDEELIDADGRKRAALNFPSEKTIKVNRGEWKNIADRKLKMALALHEILGIARYENGNYKLSAWVFRLNPNELEYGRLGVVRNRMSYCPVGESAQKCHWIHALVDLPNSSLVLTLQGEASVQLNCHEGFCRGFRIIDYSRARGEHYRAQILPDASIMLDVVVSDNNQIQLPQGSSREEIRKQKEVPAFFQSERTFLPLSR